LSVIWPNHVRCKDAPVSYWCKINQARPMCRFSLHISGTNKQRHGQMAAATYGPPGPTLFHIYVNILVIYSRFFPNLPPDSHSAVKQMRAPVTRVLHYVSNKYEAFTAFRCRENRGHGTDWWTDGRTDGVQHLLRALREGCIMRDSGNDSISNGLVHCLYRVESRRIKSFWTAGTDHFCGSWSDWSRLIIGQIWPRWDCQIMTSGYSKNAIQQHSVYLWPNACVKPTLRCRSVTGTVCRSPIRSSTVHKTFTYARQLSILQSLVCRKQYNAETGPQRCCLAWAYTDGMFVVLSSGNSMSIWLMMHKTV